MKLRTICLAVFFVAVASLIFLNGSLAAVVESAEPELSDDLLYIDPTDMSQYYAMGEYYPPNEINTINVDWQGGRVEIIAYNGADYFVEEAATRYLQENERLSYVLQDQTFNIMFLGDDSVSIDDAYKKLEIRIPRTILESLESIDINTNGEVVMKNITARQISVTGTHGEVRFTDTYSPDTKISSADGDVKLTVGNDVGYSVDFRSKSGIMESYVNNGMDSYVSGDGEYNYVVNTKSGNLNVSLDIDD